VPRQRMQWGGLRRLVTPERARMTSATYATHFSVTTGRCFLVLVPGDGELELDAGSPRPSPEVRRNVSRPASMVVARIVAGDTRLGYTCTC